MIIKLVCKFCKTGYEVSWGLRESSKFCSVDCFKQAKKGVKIPLVCKFCRTKYEVDSWFKESSKFCSVECFREDKRREIFLKKCKNCTKIFKTKRKIVKFCSAECYNEHRGREIFVRSCKFCTKIFKTKKKLRKFCSNSCRYDYKFDNHEYEIVEKLCEFCGIQFKCKQSKYIKRRFCSPYCASKTHSLERKGMKFTDDHRKNISKGKKGKETWCKGLTKYNHPSLMEAGRKISIVKTGTKLTEETKKKMKEITTRNWQNPEFVKKVKESRNLKPNKKENLLDILLQQILPNEYKYVGDFTFLLGGKNPDFMNINGKKKLIELFGDYWHDIKKFPDKETPRERRDYFMKFGFDTLIIWEKELSNLAEVKRRLLKFHKEMS